MTLSAMLSLKSMSMDSSCIGRARDGYVLQSPQLNIPEYSVCVSFHFVCFPFQQDGDVIELCQVSDIRAGGTPKVSSVKIRMKIDKNKRQ